MSGKRIELKGQDGDTFTQSDMNGTYFEQPDKPVIKDNFAGWTVVTQIVDQYEQILEEIDKLKKRIKELEGKK